MGSGVAKFEVWQSVNGHPYTKIKTTTGHAAYVTATVGNTYRFRVRAIDKKGNIGAFAYGPTFKVFRYQETSASVVYSSPWQTLNSSVYSGGHARSTTTAGNDGHRSRRSAGRSPGSPPRARPAALPTSTSTAS